MLTQPLSLPLPLCMPPALPCPAAPLPPLQTVLDSMNVPESFPSGNPQRAIYCSRTLNLRSIKAIGVCGGGAGVAAGQQVHSIIKAVASGICLAGLIIIIAQHK